VTNSSREEWGEIGWWCGQGGGGTGGGCSSVHEGEEVRAKKNSITEPLWLGFRHAATNGSEGNRGRWSSSMDRAVVVLGVHKGRGLTHSPGTYIPSSPSPPHPFTSFSFSSDVPSGDSWMGWVQPNGPHIRWCSS
jgi:hypothetical protein